MLHDKGSLTRDLRQIGTRLGRAKCGDRIEVENAISLACAVLRSDLTVVAHPLGFLHAEVTALFDELRSNERIRMHFFNKDYRNNASTPSTLHSHRWTLKSVPLVGALRNHTYSWEENPRGEQEIRSLHYRDDATEAIADTHRRGQAILMSSLLVNAGLVYCQNPFQLHTTEVDGCACVTLVKARHVRSHAEVIVPCGTAITTFPGRSVASHKQKTDMARLLEASAN